MRTLPDLANRPMITPHSIPDREDKENRMGILKWILRLLVIALLALFAFGFAARFADGPRGGFPGGSLEAGEMITTDPDWTFARDFESLELQLLEPLQSRTIWLQVYDKKLYVVSGYMNSAVGKIWKKWPAQAVKDGRAVIRIGGKRYQRQMVRILDQPAILDGVAAEIKRKYGAPLTADMAATGDVWFFALEPRG